MKYVYKTKIGVFSIVSRFGKWRAMFEDEDLGGYDIPQQAVDDLAGGHTYSLSSGVDTSTLGFPDDVLDWEFIK